MSERVDVHDDQLEEMTYGRLMSKKFRKVAADEETQKIARRGVKTAVKNKQPVVLSTNFGGNKLWRLDESPEIDWAELFTVFYLTEWAKYILQVYPYGIILDFYSEGIAVDKMNNVSLAEVDRYTDTFCRLIKFLQPHMPDDVKLTYTRLGEKYESYRDFLADIEDKMTKLLDQNGGELPRMSEKEKIATELNVRLLPGQDKDPQWREKVELRLSALNDTRGNQEYYNDPSIIRACSTSYSGWIATGSTKRSYAKFWVGVGALEKSGNNYHELVLTPKQLGSAEFEVENITIPGLIGKNFQKIRVLR